jgi:hypothetical protein
MQDYDTFLESKIVDTKQVGMEIERDRPDHTNKHWLYQKYIVEQLDCVQIGKIADRDPKTIWYWLKKHGIKTRPRGHNYKENLLQGQREGFRHSQESIEKIRQATLDDGRVPYLRNGEHWLKGAEPEDNPNWRGGITPERQVLCNSDEWSIITKRAWERDDAICQRCGLDYRDVNRDEVLFHIHHIVPFAESEALRLDLDNLVLLCDTCHHWVHSNENVDGEFIKHLKDGTAQA